MLLYIENLLKVREVFYNQADIIVDANHIDISNLNQEIMKRLS
jgi:hypothetical protein